MKTMYKIISICSVIIVLLFTIDVYYTMIGHKTCINEHNSHEVYEKVFIHNEDIGYMIRRNEHKSLVTYKFRDRWITREFWNNELKILNGNSDTIKITDVS